MDMITASPHEPKPSFADPTQPICIQGVCAVPVEGIGIDLKWATLGLLNVEVVAFGFSIDGCAI